MLQTRHRIGLIAVTLLVVVAILLAAQHYFNRQEISSLTGGCLDNGGTVELTIHNTLTNSYEFSCTR
ncbi:hypothetical protein AV656_08885 [Bhargavaea cecembensis]|uniref:Uncharacterized protein n=1 Tax=Bhargavaea cecembensis TaxID=394098 RepID=A0A161RG78_9BACL|nr:hypothetical protein [Bhargavaea cecembensis]KZE39002.1 hypothetical protein AV656_08885 [Bhargavaea cecembensis]